VGKAVKIEFVSSSLLAWFRKGEIKLSLFSHLLMRGKKSSTFGLVKPIGNPRYVNGKDPVWQPKVLAKCTSFSLLKLIGTIIDLE
jgi:hypothetical protein